MVVLLIDRVRWLALRTVIYSLPVPMSIAVVMRQESLSGDLLGALVLLGLYFFATSLLERTGLPRLPAAIGAALLYLVSSIALGLVHSGSSQTWLIGVWVSVWICGAVAVCLVTAFRETVPLGATQLTYRASISVGRFAAVFLIALAAVGLAELLDEYFLTFPFLGVAVAATYQGDLAKFGRSFWVFGVPPLAAFILTCAVMYSRSSSTAIVVSSGLAAWAVATALTLGVRSVASRGLADVRLARLCDIVRSDPGSRGIASLQSNRELRREFRRSIKGLRKANSVWVITGFPIPLVGQFRAETDGPPGSAALGLYLSCRNREVLLVTDEICGEVVDACLNSIKSGEVGANYGDQDVQSAVVYEADRVAGQLPDVCIFVERPGRGSDGRLHTMRGHAFELPVDFHLLAVSVAEKSIAIGDGGNEIGMANVRGRVKNFVDHGEVIVAQSQAASLIVSGTSNWGAYGLAAAMEICFPSTGLPLDVVSNLQHLDEAMLSAAVLSGAIDGVSLSSQPSVDGLEPIVNAQTIQAISQAGVGDDPFGRLQRALTWV